MAKNGNVLDSHSEGSPIQGIDGSLGTGAVRFVRTDSAGRLIFGSSGLTIGTVDQGLPAASGAGWRFTEYGTSGLPNFYWNIASILEIPTTVIGDPVDGYPMGVLSGGAGKVNLRSGTDVEMIGQKAMAASIPVVMASDQSNLPVNLLQIGGSGLTLGQKVMASSIPVTLASDQSNLAVNINTSSGTAINFLTPTDNITSFTGTPMGTSSFIHLWNGAARWDRAQGGTTSADGVSTNSLAASLNTRGFNYGFNGTTWDRLRSVSTGKLSVAINDSAGAAFSISNPLYVASGFDKTPAAATSFTVGTTSLQISASGSRKGIVVTNLSSNRLALAFGGAAVLDTGIVLYPGWVWEMDEGTFTTQKIEAIASAASSVVAVQEFS